MKKLLKSHPKAPYTIEVQCDRYWGNFEREFIAYSLGILDDVQMDIDYCDDIRETFWKDVFGKPAPTFKEALESYGLLKDYLFERIEECDDWTQLTFYNIDWETYHRSNRFINRLKIYLSQPLNHYWETIIIPRMKQFFWHNLAPYGTYPELVDIRLVDKQGNVVKNYF